MAAKIGHDAKYKNKFFDKDHNEIKPIMRDGVMLWYSEKTGQYHKDWFVKEIVKIGGRD